MLSPVSLHLFPGGACRRIIPLSPGCRSHPQEVLVGFLANDAELLPDDVRGSIIYLLLFIYFLFFNLIGHLLLLSKFLVQCTRLVGTSFVPWYM